MGNFHFGRYIVAVAILIVTVIPVSALLPDMHAAFEFAFGFLWGFIGYNLFFADWVDGI